jgi:hypothetical protein
VTGPHLSLSWVVVACGVASACGSSTTTSVTSPGPIAQRCQPSFDNSRRSFGADGGTGSVAVTVSRECEWSAVTEAPWAVVTSGAAGQGDGTVGFRIDRNPDPVGRNSAVVIGGQRLELAQQPAACRFDVSRPPPTIGAAEVDLRIQITTHVVCEWLAATDVPWLTVAPTSGRGSGTVGVAVAANAGGPRSGSITVAGEPLPLTQAADRVQVKGRRQTDGSVTAQEVELEDDDNDDADASQVFPSD